ncbi:MAG: hypothetical protein F6K00_01325 [Leptolyngbya sp. SIOISBB]|nr:hypothetical protein [Leptolyngbya sp. SIOISBB]
MGQKSAKYNPKNRATAVIWRSAMGLFALCIPLTAVAKSGPILPILVMLGASVGTVAVWLAPAQRPREEALAIKRLEDRIMNLEAICTSLPEFEKMPRILDENGSRFSVLAKDELQGLTDSSPN